MHHAEGQKDIGIGGQDAAERRQKEDRQPPEEADDDDEEVHGAGRCFERCPPVEYVEGVNRALGEGPGIDHATRQYMEALGARGTFD